MTSRLPVCAMIAALCAAPVLAGCANSGSSPASSPPASSPSGLAGRSQSAPPASAVAEPPPEVPPGPPAKSYAYRGGRDPLTGQATIIEGAAEPLAVDPDGIPVHAKRNSSATKPSVKARKAPSGGAIVVQKGDSLYRIAQRYHVTVAALMSANGLTSPNIMPGQQLVLPR